jgi:hypothetical protein
MMQILNSCIPSSASRTSTVKVYVSSRSHSLISNDDVQARREIKDLLIGPRAKAAGIVYLENEEHSFQVREGRRTWSVYGSPVSTYSTEIVLNSKDVI